MGLDVGLCRWDMCVEWSLNGLDGYEGWFVVGFGKAK